VAARLDVAEVETGLHTVELGHPRRLSLQLVVVRT